MPILVLKHEIPNFRLEYYQNPGSPWADTYFKNNFVSKITFLMLWHGWRIAATKNYRSYFTVRAAFFTRQKALGPGMPRLHKRLMKVRGGCILRVKGGPRRRISRFEKERRAQTNRRTWFRELNVTSVRGTVTGARILATFNLKWTLKIVSRWCAMYLQYHTFHLAPVAEPSRAGPR